MKALAFLLGAGAVLGSFLPHPAAPAVALLVALALTLWVGPGALARAWTLLLLLFLAASAVAVASLAEPTRGLLARGAAPMRFVSLVLLAVLAARHLDAKALLAHARLFAKKAGTVAWPWGHGGQGPRPIGAAAGLRLVVVTGPPGSGKTPAIAAAAASLVAEGLALAGFVQEASWEGGEKTGFRVRDLRTGELHPIAVRAGKEEGEFGTRFRFHRGGFRLARRALAHPAGILVADELGPVELRGKGHMPALRRALGLGRGTVLVCSVRRHLIPALLADLGAAEAAIVDVALESNPAERIVAAVRQVGAPTTANL